MKPDFSDILEGKPEPLWWDWRGVPRWTRWYPGIGLEEIPGVRHHALVVVHCMGCGKPYVVDTHNDFYFPDLREAIGSGHWTYGGSPSGGCCETGPFEEAISRKVLRFYELQGYEVPKWVRVPELEMEIYPSWVDREYFSEIQLDYSEVLSRVLHPSYLLTSEGD